MKNILLQISKIAENESISIGALERKIGASKGVLSRAIANHTDIQAKWLQSIVENYPIYSTDWLLTGEEPMFREEKKTEIIPENTISLVDKNSMGFILDRYEALAAENAILKQEVEQLKQSRGKYPDTIPYTDSTQKLSTALAAEPAHK